MLPPIHKIVFLLIILNLYFPLHADTWVDEKGDMLIKIDGQTAIITDVSSFYSFNKVFKSIHDGYRYELCFGFDDTEEVEQGTECIETSATTVEDPNNKIKSIIFSSQAYPDDFTAIDYYLSNGRRMKVGASDFDKYFYLELHKDHRLSDEAVSIIDTCQTCPFSSPHRLSSD